MTAISLQALADKWQSALVAREEVGRFSGGILSSKSLANADSLGEGPDEAIRIGRKIAYPVPALIAWMEKRASRRAAA